MWLIVTISRLINLFDLHILVTLMTIEKMKLFFTFTPKDRFNDGMRVFR